MQGNPLCLLLPGSAQNFQISTLNGLFLLSAQKSTRIPACLLLLGSAQNAQIHTSNASWLRLYLFKSTPLIWPSKIQLPQAYVLSFPRNEIWIPPCLLCPCPVLYVQISTSSGFFHLSAQKKPTKDLHVLLPGSAQTFQNEYFDRSMAPPPSLQLCNTYPVFQSLVDSVYVLSFSQHIETNRLCLLRPGSVLYIQKVDAEFFMAPAVFAPNWDIYLAPQEKDTWVLCSVLSSKRYPATVMFVAFWFCSIYPKRVLDCFMAPAVFAQIYICGICLVFKTICVGMHVFSTSQICDIHPVLKNSHLPTMFCRLLKSAIFIWSSKIASNAVDVLSSAQICDTYLALNESHIPAMFCRLLKSAISI
jgi:hypothetical protein